MYSFIQAIALLQSARLAVWEMCLLIFWSVTYNYELSFSLWWSIICEQTNPAAKAWLQSRTWSLKDSKVPVAGWGLAPKSGWNFSLLLMQLGLIYCLFVAPQWVFWSKLCPRSLVLDAQACFSLLMSCLMPRFWLTLLFCCLSVSPSCDSRAFLLAMSIFLPGSLAWSGSSLTWSWSWLPPHRITWRWPRFWSWSICSFCWHRVVPIRSLELFKAWYPGVFFWGLCLLMSALTSVTCLRCLHDPLPWSHHFSPSKRRNFRKIYWKLPHWTWNLLKASFFLTFPTWIFHIKNSRDKKSCSA